MTVAELIERLQDFHSGAEVYTRTDYGNSHDVVAVMEVEKDDDGDVVFW